MTTESISEMPGTGGSNASGYKIYLAQTGGNVDFDAKLKEAQEALEAAKLGYVEATEACHDPKSAQAAADKVLEAAELASAIEEETRNAEASPEDQEKREEIDRIENTTRDLANYSQRIADSDWNGRSPCSEGIPMSLTEPLLPAGTLAAVATDPLGPVRFKQDDLQSTARADMRDPSHPDYARFENVYAGVSRIDRERGYASDQSSERLAAALTVQSKVDGLDAVRHVAMNPEGTRAFAIDTQDPASPLAHRSTVDVAMAVRQPVEASNEKLAQANAHLAFQKSDSPGIGLEEPGRSGLRVA